jgi:hypothetical protein
MKMKKIIAFFVVVILIGSLAGCGVNSGKNNTGNNSTDNKTENNNSKNENNTNNTQTNSGNKENTEPKANLGKIEDYYPFKKNTHYIYEGTGNEFASFDLYNDYISGEKVQQRMNNGGTTKVNVMELNSGKLSKVYTRGEAYYRENLLNQKSEKVEVLLMEPLIKGTTWKMDDGSKRTITDTAAGVTTPTGNYKALEVTTESAKDKTIDYYAKNVGLVKSVFVSGGSQITSTLSKIEENVPLIQNINFYYPNIDDEKIYYKTIPISFNTNEITREVIAEEYKKQVNNQLGAVFSKNTEINSLYLNQDGKVYIDLNQAFMKEMNAGAGYEAMILQSVVNTIGQYYQVEKVYLTIDNQPYESGHILMGKGEYFRVQTQNSIEIKYFDWKFVIELGMEGIPLPIVNIKNVKNECQIVYEFGTHFFEVQCFTKLE